MNVLPELLSILEKDYQSKVIKPLTALIKNMLAANDDIRQYCLDLNILHHLKILLNLSQNDNKILVKILSSFLNIAAGNENQVAVIIQRSFLYLVINDRDKRDFTSFNNVHAIR